MKNAMTVDVEDYFQVSAFEQHISRSKWESLPLRVEANTDKILELFAQYQTKATFFVLGWVAERCPQLIQRIVQQGHELASHGYQHIRVINQSPEEFRQDIIKTKHLLEDFGGCEVKGYRAASFSIGAKNLWALDVLQQSGYQYSSSIYPVRHDLYGMPDAPRFAYHADNGLLEIPISTVLWFKQKLPAGGGGYFRLFPYPISRWAIQTVNQQEQQACIFYFHPWEIDPKQPKQQGLKWKSKFRHYLNLKKTEVRLTQLLQDFTWGRMDDIFLGQSINGC